MPSAVLLEVRGLREAQRNIEEMIRNLHGEPIWEAVRDCVLTVDRGAKINSPVDTGRLRASITPEVRMDGNDVVGVVGSNVFYAPFVEFGTRPHVPPLAALETWAARHHTSPFLVALGIARHGTKASRFLQRAVEENETRIRARIERACAQVAQEAGG